MAYYVIEYKYDEDLQNLVSDFRPAHREFLRELEDKNILIAAGFLRDAVFNGAMIVLKADSAGHAKEIMDKDPFSMNGLIHSMIIREWQPTIGSEAAEFDTDFPHS